MSNISRKIVLSKSATAKTREKCKMQSEAKSRQCSHVAGRWSRWMSWEKIQQKTTNPELISWFSVDAFCANKTDYGWVMIRKDYPTMESRALKATLCVELRGFNFRYRQWKKDGSQLICGCYSQSFQETLRFKELASDNLWMQSRDRCQGKHHQSNYSQLVGIQFIMSRSSSCRSPPQTKFLHPARWKEIENDAANSQTQTTGNSFHRFFNPNRNFLNMR